MIENIKHRKVLSLNDNINFRKALHQQKHLWLKFFSSTILVKRFYFITNFSVIISTSNIKKFLVVVKIERDSKRTSKEPPMDLTEALL